MSASVRALAVLVSFAAASLSAAEPERSDVRVPPAPRQLADFELLDQDGQPFRFGQHQAAALVFFGFTHCPDVCPATLHKLRLVTDALRAPGGSAPAVIMISVDDGRDTPAALKSYLGAVSKDFIGLTGDPRSVRAIAADFSAVFFKGLSADSSGNYLVEHTSQVYLVDARGRLRATFFDASVERMTQVIRSLDR